ncbi:hypothetical protein [Streptomyces sp. NPDC054865]
MPAGTTPVTRLTDAEIEGELAALRSWGRRHIAADGTHGNTVPAGYLVRVGQLAHIQQQRKQGAAWAARRRQERLEKAAHEGRARLGAPQHNPDGTRTYPVSCAEHGQLGLVRRAHARSRKWNFIRADNGSSGLEYGTRREAAGALVWVGDLAAAAAERQRRQNTARDAVPEGWAYGDWEDLTEYDIIRAPRYGKGEDDRLYPRSWNHKVEVRGVRRVGGGRLVIAVARVDGSYADPLFISGEEMKAVGFLWPADRQRPEPQPYREKLRVLMAEIGDDIATVRRRVGETAQIQALADLISDLERSRSKAVFADLRRIEAGTATLMAQVSDTNQPEVRKVRSWAVAAHLKAKSALEACASDPDFAWAI